MQPVSRNSPAGYQQAAMDLVTQETIARNFAAIFEDDFIGPGHTTVPTFGSPATGYPWVQKTVKTSGSPTVGIVSNAAGGIMQLAIASASELEEATLYGNDTLNWDMTKSAQFECRLAMSTLPSAAQVEAVLGFRSAWTNGPDSFSQYIDFQMLGSGAVNCRIKDGVISPQSVASGITLVAGAFHNFRIDVSDPTNVCFYIDGARLSPNSPGPYMTFGATGASAILQPYFSVYKASGTGVGTMQIDMVQAAMNRS